MSEFRFLHLSDLHIGWQAYQGKAFSAWDAVQAAFAEFWGEPEKARTAGHAILRTHDPDVLVAVGEFARAHRNEFDAIILTGDLATSGSELDLEKAREFVLEQLVPLGKPILVVPGNHDRYHDWQRWYRPGNPRFDWHFGSIPNLQLLYGGHEPARSFERDGVRLTFLGADFTLKAEEAGLTLAEYLGCGRVYFETAHALQRQTDAHREGAESVVCWIVHFEPECDDFFLRLIEEHLLENGAAPLILCGHTHACRIKPYRNGKVHVCGTTGSYLRKTQNALHLVQIKVREGGTESHARRFVYNPAAAVARQPLSWVEDSTFA